MAAHQAPPSLGFSRQEHWSGLPFPSPRHESDVAQSFRTLTDPMVCSLPGSSVCGIFHAGVGCHCLLRQVKEESVKVGLKLNIQKTKIMAFYPITAWQIDGETVTDFLFLGSKITADDDCSHEIKRCLVLGRRAMTNLDSILKGRDINLLTKVHLVKAMVFPVVMYQCESWTIMKAEHQRIDAFELWCWRRLLRIPWTAKRSNQSILKEISPD